MGVNYYIPIVISELDGINRTKEPVTAGIPFKKGKFFQTDGFSLVNGKTKIPVQTKVLARWSDNSIKWMLLDFQADIKANKKIKFFLKKSKTLHDNSQFLLGELDANKLLKQIRLVDNTDKVYVPSTKRFFVETKGNLRKTLRFEGKLKNKQKKSLLDFIARFSFYSNSKLVKFDFTIRNPRAAKHPSGLWDLGDESSILFKDLSLRINTKNNCDIFYKDKSKRQFKKIDSNVLIYQDSSGKKNWKSKNHVNRHNKVMNRFKGYKVYSDDIQISAGNHAEPSIKLTNERLNISVAVKDFWQNFPKAIEANENEIIVRLFPEYYSDFHEIQGGEQKTHTIFIDFDGDDLDWTQKPLFASSTPEYYSQTEAIPYLTSQKKIDNRYKKLIDCAIKGKKSFEKKNEIIDEYGWRNFGDIYGDHEAVKQKGLISHYNNQYDVVYGSLLQFYRTGNPKWFKIAHNLAKHVTDIDIYHTKEDISVYSGGMFWHTFHYVEAHTSTHRCTSKLGIEDMEKLNYGIGGGPASEHNYATGLMHHYLLTGNPMSKESVINLANWVMDMDDGSKYILRFINHMPTGKASCSGSMYYHGPGRGSGNSIHSLLDAYEITKNKKYLQKAEELIGRCIHPEENISKNELGEIESKWFYIIFLQSLGRYLDLKEELKQKDYMYNYARKSLIHYAKWMLDNEKPYKDVLDKVYIPTETWPAQDIRKSNVFDFASKYCSEDKFRRKFKSKSTYFFNRCIDDLNTFKTKTFLRPLTIIMNFSVMHDYFRYNSPKSKSTTKKFNFGKPKKFRPQGYHLYKLRDLINKVRA